MASASDIIYIYAKPTIFFSFVDFRLYIRKASVQISFGNPLANIGKRLKK